jgi:hypothetical protein
MPSTRQHWVRVAFISTSARLTVAALAHLATACPCIADLGVSATINEQFVTFAQSISRQSGEPTTFKRAPTWAQVSNSEWEFVIDAAGNRIFRPVAAAGYVAAALKHPIDPAHDKLMLAPTVRDELIDHTWRLAHDLAGVERRGDAQVNVKQEILLVCRRRNGAVERYAGRYLVRLAKLPHRRYFQVVFSADRAPVRVDTTVRSSDLASVVDELSAPSPATRANAWRESRPPLVVGTFYDPTEYRFELKAFSHEGESFIDLAQHKDPFGRDHFDLTHDDLVDAAEYIQSMDYRYWCWTWWRRYGRVGAVRGNWHPETARWEHAGVRVRIHRSLADYPLIGGEPSETRKRLRSDGTEYEYPYATSQQFTPQFYADLEQCHVACIFTHGGRTGSRLRVRRQLDVWIKLDPPSGQPLGCRRLRHLFIEGCGTMAYVAEPGNNVLLETWVQSPFIRGIRTICGTDGEHRGLDRSGWRFYGRYNKGDSISDAWAFADLDENMPNNPVTAAFGATRDETLQTLLDGRMSLTRAATHWCAVSIWTDPDEGDAGPN